MPHLVRVGQASDPLGYDAADFLVRARAMAADALSDSKRAAIDAEAARLRAALLRAGLLPRARTTP